MRLKFAILLFTIAGATAAPPPARTPERYRDVAVKFIDTMMKFGTDHYGPVHSPLFAAMLDLNTMSLPVTAWPAGLELSPGGMMHTIDHGFPDPPVGIRDTDRAPFGNNLEEDIMLLQAMYALTTLTGDARYASAADASLTFWIENCQSPATGLMASGEHASWDFVRERPYGDVHETGGRFPFYDKLYSIDPYRTLREADALWISQIGDKKTGDFSRHARIQHYHTYTGWNFPRHAGFYIWAYANAYAQSRDPKFIERADVLIESETGIRAGQESLLLAPFKTETFLDPVFRLMLWDAAELITRPKRSAWRAIVSKMDEQAFAEETHPRIWRWGISDDKDKAHSEAARRKWTSLYPRLLKYGRVMNPGGALQTDSTTLPAPWRMGYGGSGDSSKGLLALYRYRQAGDERFLREAERLAASYLKVGFPEVTTDLWPRAAAQVISLLTALAAEPRVSSANRKAYLDFAHLTADRAIQIFPRNGLFRADGAAEHYEAITGAGDLVWALLQLYCYDARPDHPMHAIDVDF